MNPIKVEKFEAMNNYNKESSCLKNYPKSTNHAFVVYILTALSCSLVFFSPIWYPSMESLLIKISLPNLISHLVTPKCLFIVGNLIVFVLVGESMLHSSKQSSHEVAAADEKYYHEYLNRNRSLYNQKWPYTSDHYIVKAHSECKKLSEIRRSSSVINGRLRPIRKVDSMMIKGIRGEMSCTMSALELSKRADDFIARVNRQRRMEASSSC